MNSNICYKNFIEKTPGFKMLPLKRFFFFANVIDR